MHPSATSRSHSCTHQNRLYLTHLPFDRVNQITRTAVPILEWKYCPTDHCWTNPQKWTVTSPKSSHPTLRSRKTWPMCTIYAVVSCLSLTYKFVQKLRPQSSSEGPNFNRGACPQTPLGGHVYACHGLTPAIHHFLAALQSQALLHRTYIRLRSQLDRIHVFVDYYDKV